MSLTSDFAAFRAFVPEFETYLKSATLFYNVGGNLPALSLGSLLHLRRALAARRDVMSQAQLEEYDRLESDASLLLNRWASNVEKKALKEISSRLNVWANSISELGDYYSSAVHQRVYLALLMPLVARDPEADKYRQRLTTLDALLRNKITTSEFVWEPALAEAYPRSEFWYLYGKPINKP